MEWQTFYRPRHLLGESSLWYLFVGWSGDTKWDAGRTFAWTQACTHWSVLPLTAPLSDGNHNPEVCLAENSPGHISSLTWFTFYLLAAFLHIFIFTSI